MHAVDVIITKRDGGELTDAQIKWAINEFTSGALPDEQMSSLLMAIFRYVPSPFCILDEVDAALGRLRVDDREILRLFAWEQLTLGEIAQVLGISANAAGVRLHRAKARLRDELRADDKERSKNPLVARQEESAGRKEARDER